MSPVWIRQEDFGVSKQVLAEDTTALRTLVSTPVYCAPNSEVLRWNSNNETSEYTTSVDIGLFGVAYELLVVMSLFTSSGDVFH